MPVAIESRDEVAPSPVTPVRLLILGAGAVVTEYYMPALRALGWERDVLIVDPSARALESARAADSEVTLRQVDFRAALIDPAVTRLCGAAVIALPNSLHEEATQLALERQLHVLCEKPLALTGDACRRLAHAATQATRTLAVGMVRRLLPSLAMLRQALDQGLIGNLTAIDVEDGEPYAWLSDSGASFRRENGGVLADIGVHYLDFVEEIGGCLSPHRYSDDWQGGVEANLVYELTTQSGVPVRLALSRTRRLHNTLVCRGERGELVVDKDVFDSCLWRSFTTDTNTRLVPERWSGGGSATLESAFARQLEDFDTSIRSGTPPAVSAERAASTIELIDWAYRHRATLPVPVEEPDKPTGRRLPEGRVFVTGATGFIGRHLVESLFKDSNNNQVVTPVRNYRTCAEIARYPVQMPRLDLTDYTAVAAALAEARFVFHLAYGREGPEAERVTVEGTRNVVEGAIAAGCESVVVLSTIYVFGQPQGKVDETWPYQPVGGSYGTSKARTEQWCLKRAESSPSTRIVILNPSCVYGPGGNTYSEMPVRMARERTFCWIEHGRGAANYIYVDNLIDAMLLAATSTQAHGQRFIVNDGCTTWRTFFSHLLGEQADRLASYTRPQLQALHRNRRRPGLLDVVRIALDTQQLRSAVRQTLLGEVTLSTLDRVAPGVLDRVRRRPLAPLRSQPVSTPATSRPPVWLADLFGPAGTAFVADRAQRVLGWAPRVTLEAGMTATRRWTDGV